MRNHQSSTHRRARPLAALAAFALIGWPPPAPASVVGGPDVIPAPSSVLNSDVTSTPPGATNFAQQAFNERQGVLLVEPLEVDEGWIPAGTVVDSHMIFLNIPDGSGARSDFNRAWFFSGPVLGVMSDRTGKLEVESSELLGHPSTVYPPAPFGARGLDLDAGDPARGEGGVTGEGYTIKGGSLIVGMSVLQPGDWIRVVTRANRPPDCAAGLATPDVLWPPDHGLRKVAVGGVPDPDGDAVAVSITEVEQDEPVDDIGDGTTAPDAMPGESPSDVLLRAERAGTGDGRVYTISFTAVDEFGMSCSGTVTVSVPHDQGARAGASPSRHRSGRS